MRHYIPRLIWLSPKSDAMCPGESCGVACWDSTHRSNFQMHCPKCRSNRGSSFSNGTLFESNQSFHFLWDQQPSEGFSYVPNSWCPVLYVYLTSENWDSNVPTFRSENIVPCSCFGIVVLKAYLQIIAIHFFEFEMAGCEFDYDYYELLPWIKWLRRMFLFWPLHLFILLSQHVVLSVALRSLKSLSAMD